jgi:iron complex outermembrane recepter protein
MVNPLPRTIRCFLISVSFLACAPGAPAQGNAPAQSNAASGQPEELSPDSSSTTGQDNQSNELQQMTVTGYIIPRVGDGPQPVYTIDKTYTERQGAQTAAQILQALPTATNNFGQGFSAGNNSSPGADAVNLRGLGLNATLTLVDGQRFPAFPLPFNSAIGFVDLNSIPAAAVDNIQILKDGGSAVYGADAVAGVVNVVLKDNYNGAQISNYFGISQRGDAETYHGSFVGGITKELSNGDKFNILAAFDYFQSGPIAAIDRPYTWANYKNLSSKYPNASLPVYPYNGVWIDDSGKNSFGVPAGTRTGMNNLTPGGEGQDVYDPNNLELAPRETRMGGLVNVTYSPTSWLKLYDHFMITDNHENAQQTNQGYGASDTVFGNPITVPSYNSWNHTGYNLHPQGQMMADFGNWNTDTRTRTLRNIIGATVFLPHSWFIDATFLYGESDATTKISNGINLENLQLALEGKLPGHEGHYFNPFLDTRYSRGFNEEFYDPLRAEQLQDNRSDIVNWRLQTGGTVFDLPSGAFTVAGGVEYRSESLIESNDSLSRNRLIGTGNWLGPLTVGRQQVFSAYYQIDIPLAGEKWSFPGLRNFDISFSQRYDDYSQFGSAAKPKIAVRWKPFDDLTFRGSYSEGFIAPSISQLFTNPLVYQTVVTDPILKERYRVTLYRPGNADLKPQTSYGYYVEMLWSPDSKNDDNSFWHWAHGFTAYIDWWQIQMRNRIGFITPQYIASSPESFPGNRVIRDATGRIQGIVNPYGNLGNSQDAGIDFGIAYSSKEYSWGKIDIEANATYHYMSSIKQVYGSDTNGKKIFQVLTGDDQFGVPGPDFKAMISLFYSKTLFAIDTFSTGVTLNYMDSEADNLNNSKGSNYLNNRVLDPPGYVHLIGSWTTADWQISYAFGAPTRIDPNTPTPGYGKDSKRLIGDRAISPPQEGSSWGIRNWFANSKITFGVKNIFDTRPPLAPFSNWLGYDSGNTNMTMRYFYVQIDKKF